MSMIVVGLSGASCTGKTTIGNILQRVFTNSRVINQDIYYWPTESKHHIKDPETGFINWEVISAFDMNSLVDDLKQETSRGTRKLESTADDSKLNVSFTAQHKIFTDTNQHFSKEKLFQDPSSEHPLLVTGNYEGVRLVLVEGILVLNDPRVADLCDHQIFIELDRETCWDRRRHRTYDPEDQIGYFDKFMWPWYLKNLKELKSAGRPIFYLDGKDSIQDNAVHILNHVFEKSK